MALGVARVVRPASKLATARWWDRHHPGRRSRRGGCVPERDLRGTGLAAGRPARGRPGPCPLAAHGYCRDSKRGHPRIEYGLLTDPAAAEAMRDPLVAYGPPTGRHDCGGREQLAAATIVKGGAVTASGW